MKETLKLKGKVTHIGEIQTFKRPGKPDLSKQILSLETKDEQKLFCEIRKNNFEKSQFIRTGHEVEIEFVFSGSEKNGKQYNNIIIYEINIIS